MGAFFSRGFDPARDLPDLAGKTFLVTGGNTGIGFATVQHLARRGARVVLAARDESRATGALAALAAEGLTDVVWLRLDLRDPRSAKKAAEELLAREARLDVLVNNAAILAAPYKKGVDGVSEIMMVNHISPFVFTRALLPLLTKTAALPGADVRIVNVASDAHRQISPTPRFRTIDDLNADYSATFIPAFTRYYASKLANVLWTKELQRRLDAARAPLLALALHPGVVNTYARGWRHERVWAWLLGLVLVAPARGAYTSVFAAAAPVVREQAERYAGAYLDPVARLSRASAAAEDPELAAELWATTEEFLRGIGLEEGGGGIN